MQVEAIPNVGSSLTLVNDGSETDQKLLAEVDWGNAVFDHAFSGQRGTQGARATGGTPQNRSLILPFRVYGTSKDDLALNISALHAVMDRLRRYGGQIRVKPSSATHSVYFDVLVGESSLTEWGNRAEATNRAGFVLSATCAPYLKQSALSAMTFASQSLPELLKLGTTIPGDAPALAEVAITASGGSAPPVSALIGWAERSAAHNLVWNGDFETDEDGWAVGGAYASAAGASIARVTTGGSMKYGSAALAITVPATIESGAHFPLYRRFKAGVTYTVSAWVRSPALTDTAQIYIAHPGGAGSSPGQVTLSATHQLVTTTWTPGADIDRADLVIRHAPATAGTIHVDGAMAYEGTTAPTLSTQIEGRGAVPPFGIIQAEACDTGSLSTWAVTSDADYLVGSGLQATTSGAGTASAEYLIDPALLVRDDYSQGDVEVVVYARVELASSVVSPKLVLSARPDAGTSFGTERYSNEWQSAGKLLTLPSSGTRFRPVRLGTLPLLSDPSAPVRWRLKVAASWAAGSSGTFGLDYLWLVTARAHALSPDAKPNDATYPDFIPSTAATVKTIRSDLSGAIAASGQNAHPDHGLGGSLLELPPGNVDVLVKLSSLVPDDPTSDATSEQLAHTGSAVALTVTPRWAYFRPA